MLCSIGVAILADCVTKLNTVRKNIAFNLRSVALQGCVRLANEEWGMEMGDHSDGKYKVSARRMRRGMRVTDNALSKLLTLPRKLSLIQPPFTPTQLSPGTELGGLI